MLSGGTEASNQGLTKQLNIYQH
uniref:Uncharacterized protein n=1 Tax=Rhizophora mucronata TaxID=61149 RepID=A0A2P2QXP7_RHIMU